MSMTIPTGSFCSLLAHFTFLVTPFIAHITVSICYDPVTVRERRTAPATTQWSSPLLPLPPPAPGATRATAPTRGFTPATRGVMATTRDRTAARNRASTFLTPPLLRGNCRIQRWLSYICGYDFTSWCLVTKKLSKIQYLTILRK